MVGAGPGALSSSAAAPVAEVPLPASTSLPVTVESASASTSSAAAGGVGSPAAGPEPRADEPEVALVLIACGIGLATGAAIVAFNVGVHEIRDALWEGQPLLSDRTLLRSAAESELWPRIVFPPLLGGLAVGALGLAIGGYDDRPAPKLGSGSGSVSDGGAARQQQAGGAAGPASGALALEQLQLQAQTVLRPVSRAVAAVLTLGTGALRGAGRGWGCW